MKIRRRGSIYSIDGSLTTQKNIQESKDAIYEKRTYIIGEW